MEEKAAWRDNICYSCHLSPLFVLFTAVASFLYSRILLLAVYAVSMVHLVAFVPSSINLIRLFLSCCTIRFIVLVSRKLKRVSLYDASALCMVQLLFVSI